MSKKTRIIILSVLAVLIVVVLSVSITTAFMKPIDQGGNITEVSLSSCAKIKLEGTTSIKLTNSYPMSRNKGLQTTPYTFTVTSYCDSYVGFNLYLATLSTNSLAASNIHYIITEKGSKEALVEGTLTSSLDDASNFTDTEKTELNTGLSGTYGNIFKLYNNKVPYKGSTTYDLYLFVDENATEYQNTTFAAGVAVKSYEREKTTINEVCSNGNNLASCVTTLAALGSEETAIYHHDSTLVNGAGDNSYRYAGANPNNYVCFGSTTSPCPTDNLYRIIGVFGDQVKLIKYDYANSNLLGTDGDYTEDTYSKSSYSTYKGELTTINRYYWNYKNDTSINGGYGSNEWGTSLFNKINLNTNYLNNIGTTWSNMIADTTWHVGGYGSTGVIPSEIYTREITNTEKTYGPSDGISKIGLMYCGDYGFAAEPSAWTLTMNKYNNTTATTSNWMYMGLPEWTISPHSNYIPFIYFLTSNGHIINSNNGAKDGYSVRPVMYLKTSIGYAGGVGTKDSPITLVV